MKELMEKRAQLMEQIEELSKSIEMEKRAFTDEENAKFDALTKEVESIDATIAQMERAEKLVKVDNKPDEAAGTETKEEMEVRAFAQFIRNERAGDSNITKDDNTAVIPKTIADKIVDKIKDISPLFKDAEKFNVKGTLSIPYVDGSNDNLTVAYADEFTDLEAKSTKLLSVDLTGYLAGVLAKVSMSLINSTDIELVDFVVAKMAMAAATFIDKEILVGTPGDPSASPAVPAKILGLSNASQVVLAGSTSAITSDVLIKLKNSLKSAYQSGAYFVMHPDTFTACQLLKDKNDRYLFNDDVVEGFSGRILGKPVYVSDQCPAIAANAFAVFYINPAQALAVKMVEDSVTILREKYATQHALGIVEWVELDARIQNQQAVAALKMAVS